MENFYKVNKPKKPNKNPIGLWNKQKKDFFKKLTDNLENFLNDSVEEFYSDIFLKINEILNKDYKSGLFYKNI